MPRFIYLQLHLLVALFATTAVLGYLITLSASALVAWRTLIAGLAAALLVALSRKNPLPPPGRLLPLLGIGGIVGLHWMCFFGAVKVANISICMAGMATASFFTAFTEPFFEKRRVRPLEVALGLVVLLGMVLVAGFERGNLLGLSIAWMGAFLAAVFPVLNRRLVLQGELQPLVMVTWEMAGACLVCLLGVGLFDGPSAYEGMLRFKGLDLFWLMVLALFCTVFAYAIHIHLLRYLSAYTGNLAMNFEPVYGIILAACLFGEHRGMHPGFYVGTGTIVLANVMHPLLLRRIARREMA